MRQAAERPTLRESHPAPTRAQADLGIAWWSHEVAIHSQGLAFALATGFAAYLSSIPQTGAENASLISMVPKKNLVSSSRLGFMGLESSLIRSLPLCRTQTELYYTPIASSRH